MKVAPQPKNINCQYLGQRGIVELEGIMQSVLFMIFFSDFVAPLKSTMSEDCWLFTLKKILLSGDYSQMWILVKKTIIVHISVYLHLVEIT